MIGKECIDNNDNNEQDTELNNDSSSSDPLTDRYKVLLFSIEKSIENKIKREMHCKKKSTRQRYWKLP